MSENFLSSPNSNSTKINYKNRVNSEIPIKFADQKKEVFSASYFFGRGWVPKADVRTFDRQINTLKFILLLFAKDENIRFSQNHIS